MKTIPYNRHEVFLAALSDSSITVPNPLSREETYLAKIAGEDVTIPDAPLSRHETYLAKLAGEDVTVPTPASRLETYLYKACGYDVETPTPVSREEVFWARYNGEDADGGYISINDSAGEYVKGLSVKIVASRKGKGIPSSSNKRQLNGYTSIDVTRCGKNLFPGFVLKNQYGSINSGYIPAPFAEYPYLAITGLDNARLGYMFAYTQADDDVGRIAGGKRTGAVMEKTSFSLGSGNKDYDAIRRLMYQYYSTPNDYTLDDANSFPVMCQTGESDDIADYEAIPYEAYKGTTYTIDISGAGTVYGGVLDVTTGLLTVTHDVIASYAGEELPGAWESDRDVYSPGTTPTTGAQVVYELAEQDYEVYQLQYNAVQLLEGVNNIWADCGPVKVNYIPDI